VDLVLLGLVAGAGPSTATAVLTVVFTAYYFLHFLVLTPLVTAMEAK
jgi:ubiquinol-cytochrome c reductase cytochrome b subunit